mmetsp:Transcript_1700/g.3426  ORF Transcript_1700/g.3426 Transcript_1700/m.3426 type:complete len:710 (-) Transcript_1700:65-2194(-)
MSIETKFPFGLRFDLDGNTERSRRARMPHGCRHDRLFFAEIQHAPRDVDRRGFLDARRRGHSRYLVFGALKSLFGRLSGLLEDGVAAFGGCHGRGWDGFGNVGGGAIGMGRIRIAWRSVVDVAIACFSRKGVVVLLPFFLESFVIHDLRSPEFDASPFPRLGTVFSHPGSSFPQHAGQAKRFVLRWGRRFLFSDDADADAGQHSGNGAGAQRRKLRHASKDGRLPGSVRRDGGCVSAAFPEGFPFSRRRRRRRGVGFRRDLLGRSGQNEHAVQQRLFGAVFGEGIGAESFHLFLQMRSSRGFRPGIVAAAAGRGQLQRRRLHLDKFSQIRPPLQRRLLLLRLDKLFEIRPDPLQIPPQRRRRHPQRIPVMRRMHRLPFSSRLLDQFLLLHVRPGDELHLLRGELGSVFGGEGHGLGAEDDGVGFFVVVVAVAVAVVFRGGADAGVGRMEGSVDGRLGGTAAGDVSSGGGGRRRRSRFSVSVANLADGIVLGGDGSGSGDDAPGSLLDDGKRGGFGGEIDHGSSALVSDDDSSAERDAPAGGIGRGGVDSTSQHLLLARIRRRGFPFPADDFVVVVVVVVGTVRIVACAASGSAALRRPRNRNRNPAAESGVSFPGQDAPRFARREDSAALDVEIGFAAVFRADGGGVVVVVVVGVVDGLWVVFAHGEISEVCDVIVSIVECRSIHPRSGTGTPVVNFRYRAAMGGYGWK